jgi:hypothetical protein
MEVIMKRRDFLKIGVGTVVAVPAVIKGATGQKTPEPVKAKGAAVVEPVTYQDWSVKFRSVTASIGRETYEVFHNDEQRSRNPKEFLAYLLSGTDLPSCETVDSMEWHGGDNRGAVTFTGVVFASNTRKHAVNRFAGFDHTGFCLCSPNSRSGMYLKFTEKVA